MKRKKEEEKREEDGLYTRQSGVCPRVRGCQVSNDTNGNRLPKKTRGGQRLQKRAQGRLTSGICVVTQLSSYQPTLHYKREIEIWD